ncbi:MAG TPA: response regulator transcription factor, partial [Ktedonobacteraceae bacterium]
MNQENENRIRVVVVDDHQVVRDGLRLILEIEGEDMELVGEAPDGTTALQLIEEKEPDVVLMDIRMPGMDGLEAIEHLRVSSPRVAVVILTTYNEDELMRRGLRAGARSYLLKDSKRETILHAIRTAAHGETMLPPDIVQRLLSSPMPTQRSPQTESFARVKGMDLTEREQEVLLLMARGERSKEIARHLGITTRTVAAHLSSIYSKLGVDSRVSAVTVALERGLLPRKSNERS